MTSDMPPHDHPIDTALWVELTDSDVRWYVCGNPHTFPGRFDVWSPDLDVALTIGKDEVVAASEPARWWIDGYLHGNEPSIYEFLELDPATPKSMTATLVGRGGARRSRYTAELAPRRVTFTNAD